METEPTISSKNQGSLAGERVIPPPPARTDVRAIIEAHEAEAHDTMGLGLPRDSQEHNSASSSNRRGLEISG